MEIPLQITSKDAVLENLNFKPYFDNTERRFRTFQPEPHEPQTLIIHTSRGLRLTAKKGYYLVSDIDNPDRVWPVDPEIFSKSYMVTRPGYCVKFVPTNLVPLVDLTNGDENRLVTIHTLEGPVTVRAGDHFLARGVNGEIWSLSKESFHRKMKPFQPE